jgi:glycosyltransferase involved in cell wall biosynthesis
MSIRSQELHEWELIVVDDGSTDDTVAVLAELTRGLGRPFRLISQTNQGPSAARNTGLDHVRGRYVAFFDSDDIWLPHHLKECVLALEANPDVDWVYGACRVIDRGTGQVIAPNTFTVDGHPRPFRKLRVRNSGSLHILDDCEAMRCQIRDGLWCGLQASVFRARLFESLRLPPYRVGEDQALTVLALAGGHRLGYLEAVHVDYYLHDDNSSAANADPARKLRAYTELTGCFEDLRRRAALTPADRRALDRRLAEEYFWHLGYHGLWRAGRRREALTAYGRGLRRWPWDWRYWRTFTLAALRTLIPVGQSRKGKAKE